MSYSPWGHKELDMTEWLTLRSQTLQEQLSLWLGHVNPEATSQHHPSSTVAHRRTIANHGSGEYLTFALAT